MLIVQGLQVTGFLGSCFGGFRVLRVDAFRLERVQGLGEFRLGVQGL